MKSTAASLRHPLRLALAIGIATWSTAALAEYKITCESRDNRHQTCPLNQGAGHVRVARNLSNTDCQQGRNWDYDRRSMWVDDGCRATFQVQTYGYHYNDGGKRKHGDNHDAKVAAGVLVGAAILGALAHHADKDDEKYRDDNYIPRRPPRVLRTWLDGGHVHRL